MDIEAELKEICTRLAGNSAVSIRAVSREENEPSMIEKAEYIASLLKRNPVAFVGRWGTFLTSDQLNMLG